MPAQWISCFRQQWRENRALNKKKKKKEKVVEDDCELEKTKSKKGERHQTVVLACERKDKKKKY